MDNLLFQKSRQEAVVSVSGSQEGMESHGRINSGPHSSSLSPAGRSGRFEGVIKGYSRTLCQLWKQENVHRTLRPLLGSATGQVPAFHLAALPRVRWWSRLYGVWLPGSCPAISLAPVDHLTEDPRRCPIRVVLSFLQQGLERRLCPFTLKAYVAEIAANHDPVEGKSVGKDDWVVRFLRGGKKAESSTPPPPPLYPLGTSL